MSKPLDKMTKAELLSVVATKDAELAVLRDQCSVLSAPKANARPLWLVELEARRERMSAAKHEAMATGHTVRV